MYKTIDSLFELVYSVFVNKYKQSLVDRAGSGSQYFSVTQNRFFFMLA